MRWLVAGILFVVVFASNFPTGAQRPADPPVYGQYPGRQQYSPLSQINAKNVQLLHVAWTYDIGEVGKTFEGTPIVVDNVMYFPTPDSKVIALNATTGKEIWKYDPGVKYTRNSRGLAYWPGSSHVSPRIIFGTSDGRLIALDPKTGKLISTFGNNGKVDVRETALKGSTQSPFWYTSAPAILHDLVIAAPALQEGPSHGVAGDGDPRAFNVLTGKQIWQFHTMPRPGELGSDTWGSPKGVIDRSGPSAWVPIAVDPQRDMVLVTTGNPEDSYYGGDRNGAKGQNLYANSVIALDAKTGKMRWYFQMVHHDLWDFDGIDSAVIQVHRDGTMIPAVAALDKNGFLFILNEITGKPVFGVEERAVAKSDVPGEGSSPTQPFPVGPPPLSRDGMSTADLTTVTPQSAKYCSELWSHYHNSGPFTPFGSTPTVNFPSTVGGPNWDSASFNPRLGYIFVSSSEMGARGQILKAGSIPPRSSNRGRGRGQTGRGRSFRQPSQYQMPYRNAMAAARFIDPDGYPCQKPPWGLLTAIDANTGKIAWKVPLGDYGVIQENGMSAVALTSLPEGPGKTQVQASCSTCHGTATVLQQKLTREGWTAVVHDMVSRGLRLNSTQEEEIINYLATSLGTSENTRTPTNSRGRSQAGATAPAQKREPTGTPNIGGSMSTAGNLVFIGATLDKKFRAFDARTGQELWSFQLGGVGMATPMSFMGSDGKQYVVIATGGPGLLRALHNDASSSPDKIYVFTLAH